ncbi:MAG: HNH endonuclease signature motif containing protein [Anaerolineae bacterium]
MNTKICKDCHTEFPATDEFFYTKGQNGKFRSICKKCYAERHRKYQHGDQYEKWLESQHRKNTLKVNNLKQCGVCKRILPATPDYFYPDKRGAFGLRGICKQCHAVQSDAWWKAHPAKRREKNKRWRKNNPEKRVAQQRRYRILYPEKVRLIQCRWRLNHSQEINEASRLYRLKNPEKRKATNRKWREKHPEKGRIYVINRRARKCSLPNTLTTEQWAKVIDYFGNRCAYCCTELGDLVGPNLRTGDHIVPLTAPNCPGTILSNMILACKTCNGSKNNKELLSWLLERFGDERAKQIRDRVDKYVDWTRENF